MALQEVLNSSIWVIKDDKSNYQPLYGQFLYTLNTNASGDDDNGVLYVGNGTEWINVMGTALQGVIENILATVPFEQIDNKTIFDAINEKANKATTLEGYGIEDAYTKTTIDAIILALEAELAGKQDKLTAGDNISIDSKNKISVTGLTKDSVGLGNVDNTSDADKPISSATQGALDLKADKSQVANVSTDGNTTKIEGNLEVAEVDTGEGGSIMTGTLVAHGQVDVDSISVGMSSPLDSVSTRISTDSKDTEIPTAKATYTFVGLFANTIEGYLANKQDKTDNNLSTTDKTIVGAINEIAGDLDSKQDKLTAGTNITISDTNEISVVGLTKASVGLGNVDNTSDANKPVSTATQEALDNKQNKLTAGDGIVIDETTNTISATGTGSGTVKSVNSVEPDDNGNVSITTANIPNLGISEDGKTITIGDKSIEPLTSDSSIAADKIDGIVAEATKATQDGNGDVISTTYAKAADLANKQDKLTAGDNITINEATNTISATDTTYTAGTNIAISAANEISVTGLTKASVGLDMVDNTSDADKPISTATQAALNDKQNVTDNTLETEAKTIVGAINENFDKIKTNTTSISVISNALYSHTGDFDNPHKVSKDQVGLGNVDNTSDADKPISSATQTALDAKQDVANLVTSFGVTPSDEKYPSEKLVNDALNQTNQRVTGVENDTQALSTSKQDKLTAGTNITISGTTISAKDTTYTAGANINISDANAISVTGVYTSEQVDEKLATKADTSSLSNKQDKLTAGDNITISGNTISATDTTYTAGTNIAISDTNEISVTGLTKASVGLGNVDNTSDANKPISSATQEALDAKQDTANLVTAFSETPTDTKYPSEKLVYDSIENVHNTVDGELATKANEDATNITGDNVTKWKEALELDVLEADLDTKQNVSNLVTTINSTSDDTHYPSAKAVYDYAQAGITSTVETTVTPTIAQTATAITDALAKKARVVVIPSLANVGAIYIKESNTYSSVNPIYPDPTNNVYEFTNMQNVKVFVDSVGDSVDLVIEYRG